MRPAVIAVDLRDHGPEVRMVFDGNGVQARQKTSPQRTDSRFQANQRAV